MTPEMALALSLLKRARDLAIGLPALGVYQLSKPAGCGAAPALPGGTRPRCKSETPVVRSRGFTMLAPRGKGGTICIVSEDLSGDITMHSDNAIDWHQVAINI